MTTTIKPGILVALRTRIAGGVHYSRTDLDASAEDAANGADVARWETTRVIDDAAEHERAKKVRGLAQTAVRRVCVASDFGLLCPEAREGDLDAAVADARAGAVEFNAGAASCRVEVYVLKGRVASTDEEAVRALTGEVRELLDGMCAGVQDANVEAIREAASRAKRLGAMLSDDAAKRVSEAVAAARAAAREIVRRVERDGEKAAEVVQSLRLEALDAARFAFLDLDLPAAVHDATPAVDMQRVAELDLDALPAAEG